jgi:hypothetical protein
MSSKFKVLSIALAVLMAFAFYSATTKADVTGSFGLGISLDAIPCTSVLVGTVQTPAQLGDQPCESTVFKIDFESDLNVNIAISGLTTSIHSHAGVTGLEDVILTFAATLGALDVSDTFVFAQPFGKITAGDGQTLPACYEQTAGQGDCGIFFVKKRVSTSISLGGVTFSNLALIEDVNFPDPKATKDTGATYTANDQNFGFGDIVTISGQTPSGITVTGTTGICAKEYPYALNRIKKHTWLEAVNPDCAGGTQTPSNKPPLFFDFESLSITGIPLSPDVTGSISVDCIEASACTLTSKLAISGVTPVPINASIKFTDLFTLAFGGASVQAPFGPATITWVFDSTFQLSYVDFAVSITLNPDTNPASLSFSGAFQPGTGFITNPATGADPTLTLAVQRAGLTFSLAAVFPGGSFSYVTFSVGAEAGVVDFSAGATFLKGGFGGANLGVTVSF